jgi:hypothetical protein
LLSGIIVIIWLPVAVLLLKDWIMEEVCIKRLVSGNRQEMQAAAEKLRTMKSHRAARLLVEMIREDSSRGVKIFFPTATHWEAEMGESKPNIEFSVPAYALYLLGPYALPMVREQIICESHSTPREALFVDEGTSEVANRVLLTFCEVEKAITGVTQKGQIYVDVVEE